MPHINLTKEQSSQITSTELGKFIKIMNEEGNIPALSTAQLSELSDLGITGDYLDFFTTSANSAFKSAISDEGVLQNIANKLNTHGLPSSVRLGDIWLQAIRFQALKYFSSPLTNSLSFSFPTTSGMKSKFAKDSLTGDEYLVFSDSFPITIDIRGPENSKMDFVAGYEIYNLQHKWLLSLPIDYGTLSDHSSLRLFIDVNAGAKVADGEVYLFNIVGSMKNGLQFSKQLKVVVDYSS
ncbi:hypothetical protein ACEOHC_003926 [Salmonella enterica]